MFSHSYAMFPFNILKRTGQIVLSWNRYGVPSGVTEEAYVAEEVLLSLSGEILPKPMPSDDSSHLIRGTLALCMRHTRTFHMISC